MEYKRLIKLSVSGKHILNQVKDFVIVDKGEQNKHKGFRFVIHSNRNNSEEIGYVLRQPLNPKRQMFLFELLEEDKEIFNGSIANIRNKSYFFTYDVKEFMYNYNDYLVYKFNKELEKARGV